MPFALSHTNAPDDLQTKSGNRHTLHKAIHPSDDPGYLADDEDEAHTYPLTSEPSSDTVARYLMRLRTFRPAKAQEFILTPRPTLTGTSLALALHLLPQANMPHLSSGDISASPRSKRSSIQTTIELPLRPYGDTCASHLTSPTIATAPPKNTPREASQTPNPRPGYSPSSHHAADEGSTIDDAAVETLLAMLGEHLEHTEDAVSDDALPTPPGISAPPLAPVNHGRNAENPRAHRLLAFRERLADNTDPGSAILLDLLLKQSVSTQDTVLSSTSSTPSLSDETVPTPSSTALPTQLPLDLQDWLDANQLTPTRLYYLSQQFALPELAGPFGFGPESTMYQFMDDRDDQIRYAHYLIKRAISRKREELGDSRFFTSDILIGIYDNLLAQIDESIKKHRLKISELTLKGNDNATITEVSYIERKNKLFETIFLMREEQTELRDAFLETWNHKVNRIRRHLYPDSNSLEFDSAPRAITDAVEQLLDAHGNHTERQQFFINNDDSYFELGQNILDTNDSEYDQELATTLNYRSAINLFINKITKSQRVEITSAAFINAFYNSLEAFSKSEKYSFINQNEIFEIYNKEIETYDLQAKKPTPEFKSKSDIRDETFQTQLRLLNASSHTEASNFEELEKNLRHDLYTASNPAIDEKYFAQFSHYLDNMAVFDAKRDAVRALRIADISDLDMVRGYRAINFVATQHNRLSITRLGTNDASTNPRPQPFQFSLIQIYSRKKYIVCKIHNAILIESINKNSTICFNYAEKVRKKLNLPESLSQMADEFWTREVAIPRKIVFHLDQQADFRLIIESIDNYDSTSLLDRIEKDTLQIIKENIDKIKEENYDRTLHEELLSCIPLHDLIRRMQLDKHYTPKFSDYIFEVIDIAVTLISLGISIGKISLQAFKAGRNAIRGARTAGLTSASTSRQVITAVAPYLVHAGRISAIEMALFVAPPLQLLQLSKKMSTGLRTRGQARLWQPERLALPRSGFHSMLAKADLSAIKKAAEVDPEIIRYMANPYENCENALLPMKQLLERLGYQPKIRGMQLWDNADTVMPDNHFVLSISTHERHYVVDPTAAQFTKYNFHEAQFLIESEWFDTYRRELSQTLVKFKDFDTITAARHEFGILANRRPFETIEGASLLVEPSWYARSPSS